jgi:hypothetical protein
MLPSVPALRPSSISCSIPIEAYFDLGWEVSAGPPTAIGAIASRVALKIHGSHFWFWGGAVGSGFAAFCFGAG